MGIRFLMVGFGMLLSGSEVAGPIVGGSASVVLIGLATFAANVLVNVKPQS